MTTPQMTTYDNGDRAWWANGQLHRLDGPAVEERANGYRAWYINGQRHRTTGPAREWLDGTCEWWVNGQQVDEGTVKLMQFLQEKIK
jgi:hypothetical protein